MGTTIEGWNVGATVGFTVGVAVGDFVVGAALGSALTVGAFEIEGVDDGWLLGEATGVREMDGCSEGGALILGGDDGDCEGPLEGAAEGRLEGALLGKSDGTDDGETEGEAEAAPLGATDGAADAKREGAKLADGAGVNLSRAKRRCELSRVWIRGLLLLSALASALLFMGLS